MLWPDGTTDRPRISSPFGPRWSPTPGASSNHRGTDFTGFTTVRAIAAGTVVAVGTPHGWSGGGTQVWVQHDGALSRSLHMKAGSPVVRVGQKVSAGQALGVIGMTGTATGVHLHLEIVVGGVQVDPVPYITARLATPAGIPTSEGDEFMAKIDDLWQRLLPGEKNVKTAGDVYLLFVDVVQRVRTAVADTTKAVWDQPVRRDGKNVSALQELADAKTLGMQNAVKLDELLKRPAASVTLTDAQIIKLADELGQKVALSIAPAVLDAMAKRLEQ